MTRARPRMAEETHHAVQNHVKIDTEERNTRATWCRTGNSIAIYYGIIRRIARRTSRINELFVVLKKSLKISAHVRAMAKCVKEVAHQGVRSTHVCSYKSLNTHYFDWASVQSKWKFVCTWTKKPTQRDSKCTAWKLAIMFRISCVHQTNLSTMKSLGKLRTVCLIFSYLSDCLPRLTFNFHRMLWLLQTKNWKSDQTFLQNVCQHSWTSTAVTWPTSIILRYYMNYT